MGRKRRRIKKKNTFIFILIVLVIVVSIFVFLKMNNDKNLELKRNKLEQDIVKHYNEFVITKRDADIYKLNGDNYTKVGLVGKGQELSLVKKDITYEDEYLKIDGFDNGYYIYYKDLEKIDKLSLSDDRYKNYIVFYIYFFYELINCGNHNLAVFRFYNVYVGCASVNYIR